MKKIIINDENYKEYSDLYKVIQGDSVNKGTKFLMDILILLDVVILIFLSIKILITVEGIKGIILMIIVLYIGIMVTAPSIFKHLEKMNMNYLKKSYPNIDTNVDEEKLKKALIKYNELSKIPEDIDVQIEIHLSDFNNTFRKMSTKQKMRYLQKEKEFWQIVAIKEKYEREEQLESINNI